MKRSIVQEKSFAFAVRIVQVARSLQNRCKDFVLSNQLMRSGTSIGANVEEALGAQSRKDFLAKMSIAAKEARETRYWLRLVTESGLSTDPQLEELFKECEELLRVLNSII
ncbi:MAG: four helix bundle protein, partial [Nitrospiraceae bacterium]